MPSFLHGWCVQSSDSYFKIQFRKLLLNSTIKSQKKKSECSPRTIDHDTLMNTRMWTFHWGLRYKRPSWDTDCCCTRRSCSHNWCRCSRADTDTSANWHDPRCMSLRSDNSSHLRVVYTIFFLWQNKYATILLNFLFVIYTYLVDVCLAGGSSPTGLTRTAVWVLSYLFQFLKKHSSKIDP